MIITPRWRKVLRDLWSNKTRTLLVVLSIAVGVAAIGMVAGAYAIISRELPAAYAAVNPASALMFTAPFDDDLVRVISNVNGVDNVEGRFNLNVQAKTGPNSWQTMRLLVIPHFKDIRVNKIISQAGAWPPGKDEIIVERSSMNMINARLGNDLVIETPDGKTRTLTISGLAHDINIPSGIFTGQASGYITFETLANLGYPTTYNQLLFTTENKSKNPQQVIEVADRVAEKLRKGDRMVYSVVLTNPGRLWFEPYMTPMVSILGIMGVVILLVSGLLVINTISALITQQIRQIGIMKAVGASSWQVYWMYTIYVLMIGLIAYFIAVPISKLGTRVMVLILMRIINFDITNFGTPQLIRTIQMILSLGVPVLAASLPILIGVRLSVREAISDYGLSKTRFGQSNFDRLIGNLRGLPRPVLLSLRNTFRQKGRLTLTLLALSIGSAIFIAVSSVYAGLNRTMDQSMSYYGFDLVVYFSRAYRIEQIANEVQQSPQVETAETWDGINARVKLEDGSESESLMLLALPPDTELINPSLLAGRWLEPTDQNTVVINTDVLDYDPKLKIGSQILLNTGDKEIQAEVVGIARSVLSGPIAYINQADFSRSTGRYGLAGAVYIRTNAETEEQRQQTALQLDENFERAGLRVGSTSTVGELRESMVSQYSVIFVFLMMMAVLLTVVGGLGLSGTMSLNVLERTREIGVMRAVGATNGSVMQIVIVEAAVIGILSWLIGLLLAFPLSWLMGNVIGQGFLQESLQFTFSTGGALLWLVVVIFLALIASVFPSRRAVRLSVREVLAYE